MPGSPVLPYLLQYIQISVFSGVYCRSVCLDPRISKLKCLLDFFLSQFLYANVGRHGVTKSRTWWATNTQFLCVNVGRPVSRGCTSLISAKIFPLKSRRQELSFWIVLSSFTRWPFSILATLASVKYTHTHTHTYTHTHTPLLFLLPSYISLQYFLPWQVEDLNKWYFLMV